MEFNPRTATGIPTEPVGSIPRPLKLQQAYAAYDAKKIPKAQLEDEQNAAVADTIKRFEATGSPIITDGEQRVSSFATYPNRRYTRGQRTSTEPRVGRAILRDLRRWS